jgi:hypothetical protein
MSWKPTPQRTLGLLCWMLFAPLAVGAQEPLSAGPHRPARSSAPAQIAPAAPVAAPAAVPPPENTGPVQTPAPVDPPLGYSGPSGIAPRELQQDDHFVPVEDRWRIGFPDWDRYDKGHPPVNDYSFAEGSLWNPYAQNVLKGDYPIFGQHTFMNLTVTNQTLLEYRDTPVGTTPFESTRRPFQEEFFGQPNQVPFKNNLIVSFELFHGDASFKPADWRVRVVPVFDVNYFHANELAEVDTNVLRGRDRTRGYVALQEWFVEAKLADLSPNYDFVSVRVGSQPFTSDFRGFLFDDVNRAIRVFGTLDSNRAQFNLALFRQLEKDTNSELNSFHDRAQTIAIGNFYYQDFIVPGYTAEVSVHYNHDESTFKFDKNNFLVRPDPVGIFQPHNLDVFYLGWGGDGHIGRFNVTHQLYWALGHDHLNPLAGRDVDINAWFAAAELSYDRDWARFRTSFLFASGDNNIQDKHANGFDTILDNPNFAGGQFSYWQRQAIRLFGVNLVNRESIVPDLRSSKIQGQSNFVNPGLYLFNVGVDFDVTPKLRVINNLNFLWFDELSTLNQFTFQKFSDYHIGKDASIGLEYRPLLSNNVIVTAGAATLIPGSAFKAIYDKLFDHRGPLFSGFVELNLTY